MKWDVLNLLWIDRVVRHVFPSQETIEFQKLYVLLWGVFSSSGIRVNLAVEYGQFRDCQTTWFDVLQSCVRFKCQLVPSTTESKCLTECAALCKKLNEVHATRAHY